MAQEQVHLQKAALFWQLAERKFEAHATPFLCVNLAMYTVGHLIEALLARQSRHPASQPKGVPHGDRDAMLRKLLVPQKIVAEEWANCYSELVGRRDTFIEGGIPQRSAVTEFMSLAAPMVTYLYARLSSTEGVRHGNC